MKKINYWTQRSNKLTDKSIAELDAELAKQYLIVYDDLIDRLESLYDTIMAGDNKSISALYSYNKYFELQERLQMDLGSLGRVQEKTFDTKLIDLYRANSELIGGQFNLATKPSMETAKMAVRQIWCADNKSWSDRIWTNQSLLKQHIEERLTDCIIRGASHDEFTKEIMTSFGTSYNNASRLARTELSHIQNQSAVDKYKEAGVEYYEVLSEPDCCPECAELEGKRFRVEDLVLPVHPSCKCCTLAILD